MNLYFITMWLTVEILTPTVNAICLKVLSGLVVTTRLMQPNLSIIICLIWNGSNYIPFLLIFLMYFLKFKDYLLYLLDLVGNYSPSSIIYFFKLRLTYFDIYIYKSELILSRLSPYSLNSSWVNGFLLFLLVL